MLYSTKHRFVYMPPPKTGTTTISSILFEEYEVDYWDFKDTVPVRLEITDPKGYVWPRHIIHLPEELQDYFVFATIRNPYRHTLSQYWNQCFVKKKKVSMAGFHKYLSAPRLQSFYHLLHRNEDYKPPKGCVHFEIHKYLDTERLTEGFNELPFVQTPVRLQHLKASIKDNLCYTEEMAQLVLEKRRCDFDFFGYDTKIPEDLCSL